MPLAIINFLDQHGRPIDPGYGQGGTGNYPSTGPIYGGGHPGQGLPGGPQYPSQGPVYPGGGAPVDPGWGIPEGARPDNGQPAPPEVTPQPPQGEASSKIIVAVYTPNRGWNCRMYEPGHHPDHGLPTPPVYPGGGPVTPPQYPTGQPVPPPGTAQPKR